MVGRRASMHERPFKRRKRGWCWQRLRGGAGRLRQPTPGARVGTATGAPAAGGRHRASAGASRTLPSRGWEQREEQDQRGEPACPPRLSSRQPGKIDHSRALLPVAIAS